MMSKPRVLMDVAPSIAGDLRDDLVFLGCECELVRGAAEAVARASLGPTALVVVSDEAEGRAVADALHERGLGAPVVGVADLAASDAIAHLAQGRTSWPVPTCARPTRVLVVDDDEDIRWLLEVELRDAGFEVALAADGREALARLQDGPVPDVVVLDIMMPHMSGQQLLQRLSRLNPPPRAVVYSAYAMEADRLHPCVGAVLRKPASVPEIVAALGAATS